MNTQLLKKDQAMIDLSRVYDSTVRSFISNTFAFASSNLKITNPEIIKRYKQTIIFALWQGCEYGLTTKSVVGNNDIFAQIKFMQGLVNSSEKLTTDNFYNCYEDSDVEKMIKALNEGVNRMIIEEIKLLDKDAFTEEQKSSMTTTLLNYEVTKEEAGVVEPIE